MTTFVAGEILTAAKLNTIRTPAAWETWTPTWTNFTIGSATQSCSYFRSGNLIVAYMSVTLGSGSTMGTSPLFTLPVTASSANFGGGQIVTYRDVSVPTDFEGIIRMAGTTQGYLLIRNVAGANDSRSHINATTPFTWASGDIISGYLMYQAA